MKDSRRTITAKLPGTCPGCGQPIQVGDKITQTFNQGTGYRERWHHQACHIVWLGDGRMIPGSGGVGLRVAINGLGQRVGDNAADILEARATYAPDGMARAEARDGLRELGLLEDQS